MFYPFPGMNPWLESPQLWRGVHSRLINILSEYLAPLLEPRYFVDVESHTYLTTASDPHPEVRYPDLSVIRSGGHKVSEPTAVFAPEALDVQAQELQGAEPKGSPDLTPPIIIELPDHDPIEEPFLQIKRVETGEVVTVIEVLSHTNKRGGENRQKYLRKRQKFLRAPFHFVEMDLLRAWEPMPYLDHPASDYRIFVHRKEQDFQAHLYPFTVRQPVPAFPLPLLPGDQEPPIGLGRLIKDLFHRARYQLILDYTQPPEPPLREEDAVWAQKLFSQPVSA